MCLIFGMMSLLYVKVDAKGAQIVGDMVWERYGAAPAFSHQGVRRPGPRLERCAAPPDRQTIPPSSGGRAPGVILTRIWISAGRALRAALPDPGINLQSIFGPCARVPTECLPLDQLHHGMPQLLRRYGSFHGDRKSV